MRATTFLLSVLLSACWAYGCKPEPNSGKPIEPPVEQNNTFELSYWIDMDIVGNHLRGYWYDTDYEAIAVTPETYVANAVKRLNNVHKANKLYVIYHRQYEISAAQTVFGYWKKYCAEYGIEVVPCVVLQSYSTLSKMNFTDGEISDFARWSLANINADEFAIYDVYTRDAAGSPQDVQLKCLYNELGNVLVKVGMQPVVKLNDYYKYAVQDCWTAECQGRTNELWETPVYYKGSYNYGRKLLENWVKDRIVNDNRRWVYCMIPVAWDYDTAHDKPSYDCPGDNALTNDPPIDGRIALCHKYISGCYASGMNDPLMGGYSCDLHILHANTAGCGDKVNFYTALRTDTDYIGKFAGALTQIANLYESLTNESK